MNYITDDSKHTHCLSVRNWNISQYMLHTKIIAVCSQTHTKHKNTLCGQNVEKLNDKPGAGVYTVAAVLKMAKVKVSFSLCTYV